MIKYCIVPSCKNNTKNSSKKCFLLVPVKREIRMKWFEILKVDHLSMTSNHYVCEDHFDLEKDSKNWMFFKTMGRRLKIRDEVVPHKYLTGNSVPQAETQISSSQKKRKEENLKKLGKISRKRLEFPQESSQPRVQSEVLLITPPRHSETQPSTSCSTLTPPKFITPDRQHTESQPSTSYCTALPPPKLLVTPTMQHGMEANIISSPSGKITVTHHVPSPSYSSSSTVSDILASEYNPSTSSTSSDEKEKVGHQNMQETIKKHEIYKIEKNCRLFLGIPDTEFYLMQVTLQIVNIRLLDLYITLKKIRLDDSFERLGIDFGMGCSYISKKFHESVPKIVSKYQELIYWPARKIIYRQLPVPFRARYRNIQSIIDCLEIQIMAPSNPTHQALTWSEYKKCNTVKYLISSTPNGLVNFVSPGYGGRITDREIVQICGYLDVLPDNCSVMADRGFKNIETMLHKKQCSLVRPPSVITGEKCSRAEVLEGKRIASLRIHIERVIRRLREFQMLAPHATTHHQFLCIIDYIMMIACAIINMQGRLIK